MRWLGLVALALGCGSPGGSAADASIDGLGDGYPPCASPEPFPPIATPARILHVEAGAAPAGDGSVDAPFATLAAAAAAATPGTLISLGLGMHAPDQYIEDLRGAPDAPIWLTGLGEGTVFQGGGVAIHLTRPAYVVLEQLQVRGASANGISIDDGADYGNELAAHHLAVRSVSIHDVGGDGNQDCLKVSGVNDLGVYDSHFARCGGAQSGSGIDFVGGHRNIVARNRFEEMSGTAVQAKGGAADIDIRDNRIRDGGERVFNLGGSTGFEYFRPPLSTTEPNVEARRIRAFNNVVVGTTGTPFAFVGCVDCLVAHNLFYGEARFLVRILQETVTGAGYTFEAAQNGRVINNSFVWNAAVLSAHVNVGANTEAESFSFSHNLWHATDDPSASTPTLPVAEDGSVVGVGTGYSGDAEQTELCASAPEVGAGIAVPEVTSTILGDCRAEVHTIGPLVGATCP